MASITIKNLEIKLPIYDSNRSFRKLLFKKYIAKYVGGNIQKRNQRTGYEVTALRNINMQVNNGDRVGLIGHNGSGKTTLLRALAGVYEPSAGEISIEGKITALFNTSLGLDTEDTGYENIKNIGMCLGLTDEQIEKNTNSIIKFSELDSYIHLPARTYSSGMLARLSFSVATSIDTDILLLDEGLGVSDARFAQKATQRLQEFYKRSQILFIASHGESMIQELCNKALLLEHGNLIFFGSVDEAFQIYNSREIIEVDGEITQVAV